MRSYHQIFHAMLSSFSPYYLMTWCCYLYYFCVDLSYHHMSACFRFNDNDLLWYMYSHVLIIAKIQMFGFQKQKGNLFVFFTIQK